MSRPPHGGSGADDAEAGANPGDDGATAPVIDDLWAVIEDRKDALPNDSYTADLLTDTKGIDAVLEKLGEETTELVLAAKDGDDDAVAHEAADVVYHLLVVLAARDQDLDDLRSALAARRE